MFHFIVLNFFPKLYFPFISPIFSLQKQCIYIDYSGLLHEWETHPSSTIWQPAKTTDSSVRQILGFTFIKKTKDLSKILAVRVKAYVQSPPQCWLNPVDLDIFLSSTQNVIILKATFTNPSTFFLCLGFSFLFWVDFQQLR